MVAAAAATDVKSSSRRGHVARAVYTTAITIINNYAYGDVDDDVQIGSAAAFKVASEVNRDDNILMDRGDGRRLM